MASLGGFTADFIPVRALLSLWMTYEAPEGRGSRRVWELGSG
jgi:hypothetical protein